MLDREVEKPLNSRRHQSDMVRKGVTCIRVASPTAP
jgi:hypothetical protein